MVADKGPNYCGVCNGIGGWNKDTGKPRTAPQGNLKDEFYHRCPWCKGTGKR